VLAFTLRITIRDGQFGTLTFELGCIPSVEARGVEQEGDETVKKWKQSAQRHMLMDLLLVLLTIKCIYG
jgi:hypothetical protein